MIYIFSFFKTIFCIFYPFILLILRDIYLRLYECIEEIDKLNIVVTALPAIKFTKFIQYLLKNNKNIEKKHIISYFIMFQNQFLNERLNTDVHLHDFRGMFGLIHVAILDQQSQVLRHDLILI